MDLRLLLASSKDSSPDEKSILSNPAGTIVGLPLLTIPKDTVEDSFFFMDNEGQTARQLRQQIKNLLHDKEELQAELISMTRDNEFRSTPFRKVFEEVSVLSKKPNVLPVHQLLQTCFR